MSEDFQHYGPQYRVRRQRPKSRMVQIRVSKDVKAHLKELAAREGKTLSAFLRESATATAHRVLKGYRRKAKP